MAIAGCLYRLVKAGVAALDGDSVKVNHELDKGVEALRRPSLCEIGEDVLDWFDW